jgi:hypothetical protein
LALAFSPQQFLHALGPGLLLLALNYVWVMRSDAAFEEASAAYAEARALEPANGRRPVTIGQRRAAPFRLATTGRPELAIVWKNLILLGRYATVRTLVRAGLGIGILLLAFSRAGKGGDLISAIVTLALVAVVMTVLVGPQIVRNDLRQDLANLALLKTWPVRGAAIIRGEVLASSVLLTVITWLLLLAAATLVQPRADASLGLPTVIVEHPFPFALAAATFAPAVILAQLVLHNAMAILFPAWVAVGSSRSRGIDAIGQRLIMAGAIVLTLTIAVLPAALIAWPAALVLVAGVNESTAGYALVPPSIGVLMSVIVLAECWVAIQLLGGIFDRTDVTALEAVE